MWSTLWSTTETDGFTSAWSIMSFSKAFNSIYFITIIEHNVKQIQVHFFFPICYIKTDRSQRLSKHPHFCEATYCLQRWKASLPVDLWCSFIVKGAGAFRRAASLLCPVLSGSSSGILLERRQPLMSCDWSSHLWDRKWQKQRRRWGEIVWLKWEEPRQHRRTQKTKFEKPFCWNML